MMSQSTLLMVLALCVTPSIHGEDLVRSKRQTDISCDEDTDTQIITTFLFPDKNTCPQLIGGVTDSSNEEYRKECATWLKLGSIPSQVPNTHVSECHEFSNGTTKYRTKICCDGKPNLPNDDQLICFTCHKDPVLYDNELKYYHTQHCNHYGSGPKICEVGEVCAVELNFNTTYKGGLVTKSCMPSSRCADLENSNGNTCKEGPNPYCAYCYGTMYGNYDSPLPRLVVTVEKTLRPCDPNPCHWRGTCETNGTQLGDPYICHCRPGFRGNRCQTHGCSSRPCKNGGICSVSYSPPYYRCRCHIQRTGNNCTESAKQCSSNPCENGGTCYVEEGPNERCLCPDGFVGTYCEKSRPLDCGTNGDLRTVYANWSPNIDNYNCSYIDSTYSQKYLNSYKPTCYSTLRSRFNPSRPLYQPGIDGPQTPHQKIAAYSCEQGRGRTWVRWQICCDACDSNPCQNGGWCIPGGELFTCRCRFNYGGQFCEHKLSSCYASGDPHYYTFDGAQMHFQGECKYVMTENLAADTLPYFRVTIKNEKRVPKWHDSVTFPKYAEVEVYDVNVRLGFAEHLKVDGVSQNVPFNIPDSNGTERISIMMNGLKLQLKTVFGLVVQLSMSDKWTIIIRAPGEAAGRVDGLCRDLNGSASDDYVLPNGTNVTDHPNRDFAVGDYFYIQDDEHINCSRIPPPPPVCDEATRTVIRSNTNYCGYIEHWNGPFAQCISSAPDMMVDSFIENCIYDICVVYGESEVARRAAACGSLAAFADACSSRPESSPASSDWKITTRCVPECPGNLVYNPRTTACKITCQNPDPVKCSESDTENCVCESDTDVVLPNDTCVHASVCGCVREGREIGEAWCTSGSTLVHECVLCTECARPVGKVVMPGNYPADVCGEPIITFLIEGDGTSKDKVVVEYGVATENGVFNKCVFIINNADNSRLEKEHDATERKVTFDQNIEAGHTYTVTAYTVSGIVQSVPKTLTVTTNPNPPTLSCDILTGTSLTVNVTKPASGGVEKYLSTCSSCDQPDIQEAVDIDGASFIYGNLQSFTDYIVDVRAVFGGKVSGRVQVLCRTGGTEGSKGSDGINTTTLAVVIILSVFIVVLVALVAYLFYYGKRRQRQQTSRPTPQESNGSVTNRAIPATQNQELAEEEPNAPYERPASYQHMGNPYEELRPR